MVDVFLDRTVNSGRDLEQKGLLRIVHMGYADVITRDDPEPYIGTYALMDCGSLGISDTANQVAGVVHVSFKNSNPDRWYERFTEEAEKLLDLAHEKGGKSFIFSFVNVRTGYRRVEENRILGTHAEKWIQERKQKYNDVISYDWFNGEAFMIDKSTGKTLPY